MARIVRCDRCKEEISGMQYAVYVSHFVKSVTAAKTTKEIDLCSSCSEEMIAAVQVCLEEGNG